MFRGNRREQKAFEGQRGWRYEGGTENDGKLIKFIYNDQDVIAEENDEGQITRYVRGLGLISSDCENARTYYHYVSDEKGSITDIVAAAVRKKLSADAGQVGAEATAENTTEILNHYDYDEFGNLLVCEENVPNRFRYAGEIYDAVLGQYYLRARFYNPLLGRFNQEDDRYDDGLNLYAYCKNNPIKYVDPTGHGTTSGADKPNTSATDTDTTSSQGTTPVTDSEKPMSFNDFEHAHKGEYANSTEYAKAYAEYKAGFETETTNTTNSSSHGNSLDDPRTNYGYALVDKDTREILKFGESIDPDHRYSQSYLDANNAEMVVMDSGSKRDIHNWQHDMNEYYRYKYGSYPPLNKKGW